MKFVSKQWIQLRAESKESRNQGREITVNQPNQKQASKLEAKQKIGRHAFNQTSELASKLANIIC